MEFQLTRVAPDMLVALLTCTRAMLPQECCDGVELSDLVGRGRGCFFSGGPRCSLRSVHKFIHCARRRQFTIWSSVRQEAWALMVVPLLTVSLAAAYLDRVMETGASELPPGVVCTDIDR